ncbi:hypothetical protein TNCV_1601961 [Trichonephila clavipes]|nr:hypothetical protein TNCV_1601961 [Trichonephila clavipes]
MLATELSVAPSDNLKIIELKYIITNCDKYDDEFVKDMLSVIVEERTTTEKQKSCGTGVETESRGCGSATRKRIRTGKKGNFNLKCRSCHKHLLQVNSKKTRKLS